MAIVDAGRAYLVFCCCVSSPSFGTVIFHRKMHYWNFGSLGSSRGRGHSAPGGMCSLQGGYLGLQLCYRFLRGFLELPKLILQVLNTRGLGNSRRDTKHARQSKSLTFGCDHSISLR
jgi:hypothetical protein